jgi:hypothetical protein
VALTDDQHEEMRTGEVVELYVRGSIDHETFIWADGMEDWKSPWEIPMIATALAARGLKKPDAVAELDDDFPLDEPSEEDATIVASVGALIPPSSRGKQPSGVWHEPGRDDDEVGFEDQTVSLDGKSVHDLLQSVQAGTQAGRAPQKSKPEVLASEFDDVPTRVQEEYEPPPPSTGTHDVDDLLLDADERTLAMEDGFRADSRPLSTADLMSEDETTIEQAPQAPAVPGDSFSLDALMGGVPAAADPLANLDLGPPGGRDRPLDSLWEPTSIQNASGPYASPGPVSQPGPFSAPGPAAAPKKSRAGCIVIPLLLLLLVAGAAAASFFTKQPPNLYGADGMPKIPGLTR